MLGKIGDFFTVKILNYDPEHPNYTFRCVIYTFPIGTKGMNSIFVQPNLASVNLRKSPSCAFPEVRVFSSTNLVALQKETFLSDPYTINPKRRKKT